MSARPSPLARSIRHAALALSLCGSALATTAAWAEPLSYSIPAGSLAAAISQFAAASGVTISFSSEETAGLQSAGLQGSFELEQGFARLLQGSGLRVQQAGEKRYLLIKPQDGSALELGATSVNASSLGAATEGTGSYTTGKMQTATKLAMSMRETPQSVTVITRQRMDDEDMNTLNDVVEKTPGLTVQRSGIERPTYYARGFTISNILYDGLPTSISSVFTRDSIPPPDLTIFDRVEVVKGATGLTQGSGNPSAAINLVRKRPTYETQASVTGSAGSWDSYRSELDISGPLNESRSVRGRTVLAYQSKDNFQDVVDNERTTLYAIGEMDLTDSTTVSLGISNQNDNKTTAWGGVPMAPDGSDLHLPRSTFLGNDWGRWDQDNTSLFAELEHRFDNGWKTRFAATKTWNDADILASYASSNYVGGWNQITGKFTYENEQQSYDFFASGPYQLLGREHELVVGLNYRKDHFDGTGGTSTLAGMDIYNWDPSATPRPTIDMLGWGKITDSEQRGAYLTSRFNLTDSLKLILGGRLDWYESLDTPYYMGLPDPETQDKVTRHLTRYAGLIYTLDEHHSLYTSFTDIFQPQGVLDVNEQPIEAMLGKNLELGIKGEYFGGALNASAAVFRIDQENRATELADQTQCPNYELFQSCSEVSGKIRSEGLELEVSSALTPHWQLAAGYTYVSSKYKEDKNEARVGTLYDTDLPRHLFKLSTSYTLPGELSRWRVGGSLYRQNDVYNKGSTYRIEQDAYTLVGVMLGYQATADLDVRFNVNNLFDKRYYHNIDTSPTTSYNIYGDPRNASVTAKYRF